jgi:hypothetical protein
MRDPPVGTYQRIRTRSIWAVAFFAASLPPAFIGLGIAAGTEEQASIALAFAFAVWALGFLFAVWAAFPTLRYWEALPQTVRWQGAAPLLSVSLFATLTIVAGVFAA